MRPGNVTSGVNWLTTVAAVLALASSLGLARYLEVAPEVPSILETFRSFIYSSSPTGEVAVSAPAMFDFSESNYLLAWAVVSGAVAVVCLAIAAWKGPDSEGSHRRAICVIASLLTFVCLGVLFPILLAVYRAGYL